MAPLECYRELVGVARDTPATKVRALEGLEVDDYGTGAHSRESSLIACRPRKKRASPRSSRERSSPCRTRSSTYRPREYLRANLRSRRDDSKRLRADAPKARWSGWSRRLAP